MTMLMFLLAGILCIILVLLGAVHAPHTTLSAYELERRKKLGDREAERILRREALLAQAARLRLPLSCVLLILVVLLLTATFGWQKAVLLSILVAFMYERIAGLRMIKNWAGRFTRKHENVWLELIEKYRGLLRIISGTPSAHPHAQSLGSLEELQHVIETSRDILADDDKKLLARTVGFKKYHVRDVMTMRGDIVTIEQNELLGPLVLSDLYKTGHTMFPVVIGTVDHVVGFLDIRSLLTLESEFSVVAAEAMTPEVLSVPASETLHEAMDLFLRSGQQLLLVTDEEGEVIGLLALSDILGVLFGRH